MIGGGASGTSTDMRAIRKLHLPRWSRRVQLFA